MAGSLRKTDRKSRTFLLAEFDRICRQERTPNEQMIERFLACEEAQKASRIAASLTSAKYHSEPALPTPTALLPWLH